MSYAAYVAVVAISNLVIGFSLAAFTRGGKACFSGDVPNPEGSGNERAFCEISVAEIVVAKSAIETAGVLSLECSVEKGFLDQSSSADASEKTTSRPEVGLEMSSSASSRTHSLDLLEGNWSEVATATLNLLESFKTVLECSLRETEGRNNRLSSEERQQCVGRIQDAANCWLSDADLAANRLCAAIKKLPDGKSVADHCERMIFEQVAQTETSVSNLSRLDCSTDSEQAVSLVAQELRRLIDSCVDLRAKLQHSVDFISQSSRD